jgi:hypothetical protein
MKTIRMQIHKFSRPGVILLATVVAIITSIVVANATQTITTPNAAFVPFNNLAVGANTAPITLATNRSVLVMGCTTIDAQGVGQVSVLANSGNYLHWVGLEANGSGITHGAGNTGHIVYIDELHLVDIQAAGNATIRVHDGSTIPVTGNVTLIW